jgi:hypothetical protein
MKDYFAEVKKKQMQESCLLSLYLPKNMTYIYKDKRHLSILPLHQEDERLATEDIRSWLAREATRGIYINKLYKPALSAIYLPSSKLLPLETQSSFSFVLSLL